MDSYHNFNPNAAPCPPNPPTEFNQHQLKEHQLPPQPPLQWYPNQSHYQPTLQPPPPPPPPPGMTNQYPTYPQQWNPHPTENHSSYPPGPPPPVPYPNQQYPVQHQFPPMNRPQMHPFPPYHVNQVPTQPYSAGHQEWGNSNWIHHQGYEHTEQGNNDDWATRAKAWAAAKSAMDSQQQQSPFPHSVRADLQAQFHDQYANVADPQHLEMKPGSHPVAYPQNPYGVDSYQQVQLMDGKSSNTSGAYQYGQGTFSPACMTSGPDNQVHKDGSLIGDSRSTVHQKEVPSSYSSSAGKEVANQSHMQFSSYPGPGNALQGGHQLQPMPPAVEQPELMGRPFSYHNHNGDLSDKPLDFAPRGNVSSMYPHQGQYANHMGVESSTINHSWASHLAPGNPSAANSVSQFDPSMSTSSAVPGQVAPLFGTVPSPNLQPTLPSVSGPLGLGLGGLTSLVSATTYSVDAYGASSADRPKKAAVPNWLKEEIIKKKAIMATSAHEYCKEETQLEGEIGHQSFVKDDQVESKSVDSLRSAEEEDDDEDYVEAARTAAINKEIKRVLTEVLLKVTDDLFDEIATRVLNEEEVTTEVAMSQSSAKVLVPDKSKGTDAEEDTRNQSSEMPGGLLGLVSYGTDSDDENDEVRTQERINSKKHESVRNGHSLDENVPDDAKCMEKLDSASSMGAKNTDSFGRVVEKLVSGTKGSDRKQQNGSGNLDAKNSLRDREQCNQDRSKETSSRESRIASNKRAAEYKTSSQSSPVTDAAIDRVAENQSGGKHEKHPSKGELDEHNGPKDGKKEGSGTDEKQNDSISRKRSSHYDENYKTETERGKREGGQERGRRDQLEDDIFDRSRHKHSSNSNRHKKGRSPSPRTRRKKNKIDSSVSGGSSSTNDESLDDSERKSWSKRRHRYRKRQVSPSPEKSQRRQSSYSVEASRKKRSRSRSPRRHR